MSRHAASIVVGVALALVAAKPASARPLVLEDYYRIVSVQAPAMSPDGKWVAFIRSAIVENENRRSSELWLVPSDGSAPARRISDPALGASNPRWSPDGQLLAFTSRRRGGPPAEGDGDSIWFLKVDRIDEPATHIKGVGGTPIFSPDSKWIAFTRRVAKPKTPQYASDSEKVINERFKGKSYEWLNYRFDQRGYLPDPRDPEATPPEELFIVPRAGGDPKQLTSTTVTVRIRSGAPTAVRWRLSPTSTNGTSTHTTARTSGRFRSTGNRSSSLTMAITTTPLRGHRTEARLRCAASSD